MKRAELKELQYIAPIANVGSVAKLGILSHRKAKKTHHHSVAMKKIQDIRSHKRIPGGLALHDYANLYICARNPMLYKLKSRHKELCVLRLNPSLLDARDVVVSDGNAASEYTRFAAAPEGLSIVDHDRTFAEWWTSSNPIEKYELARRKCAEILVPIAVKPEYIFGAYVSCEDSLSTFESEGTALSSVIDQHLFFL